MNKHKLNGSNERQTGNSRHLGVLTLNQDHPLFPDLASLGHRALSPRDDERAEAEMILRQTSDCGRLKFQGVFIDPNTNHVKIRVKYIAQDGAEEHSALRIGSSPYDEPYVDPQTGRSEVYFI